MNVDEPKPAEAPAWWRRPQSSGVSHCYVIVRAPTTFSRKKFASLDEVDAYLRRYHRNWHVVSEQFKYKPGAKRTCMHLLEVGKKSDAFKSTETSEMTTESPPKPA